MQEISRCLFSADGGQVITDHRHDNHLDHGGVLDGVGISDYAAPVDNESRASGALLLQSLPGHRPARQVMRAVDLLLQAHFGDCDESPREEAGGYGFVESRLYSGTCFGDTPELGQQISHAQGSCDKGSGMASSMAAPAHLHYSYHGRGHEIDYAQVYSITQKRIYP